MVTAAFGSCQTQPTYLAKARMVIFAVKNSGLCVERAGRPSAEVRVLEECH